MPFATSHKKNLCGEKNLYGSHLLEPTDCEPVCRISLSMAEGGELNEKVKYGIKEHCRHSCEKGVAAFAAEDGFQRSDRYDRWSEH